jgi:hypothetical protein
MTVFTHDHFAPSTQQMAGLYGGLLAEPRCSTWTSLDGKVTYGKRFDGGPTDFAANILPDPACTDNGWAISRVRLSWQDLQLVYRPRAEPARLLSGQDPMVTNCARSLPARTGLGRSTQRQLRALPGAGDDARARHGAVFQRSRPPAALPFRNLRIRF